MWNPDDLHSLLEAGGMVHLMKVAWMLKGVFCIENDPKVHCHIVMAMWQEVTCSILWIGWGSGS